MTPDVAGFLFAYFTSADEPDGEQVRLAVSEDTTLRNWHALDGGRPILRSNVGERGVRDPFLLRAAGLPGETSRYYLLATDLHIASRDRVTAWQDCIRYGSRSVVVWDSRDLVSWSEPWLLQVAPPEAGDAWAPEATFDPTTGQYFLYWASTLYPRRSDRRRTPSYHRMLSCSTTDFRQVSDVRVWHDPGWSVIDSTVVQHGGSYYRFTKDERSADSSRPEARFITIERSTDLRDDCWELVTDGIGSSGVTQGEGPIVVESPNDGTWYLFIDEFGGRRYQAFSATSPASREWTYRPDIALPDGASHGSMLGLTSLELEVVRQHG